MLGNLRKIFILIIVCLGFFLFGYLVHRQQYFPFGLIESTGKQLRSIVASKWYYSPTIDSTLITINTDAALDWPIIVTSIDSGDSLKVKILNNAGELIHNWNIEWFEIWPEAEHLPKDRIPQSRPGTMVHGVELIEDGSIVFNFENLGLVRLDKEGNVLWKLPYLTHHSITRDGDDLWVCGQKIVTKPEDKYPNYQPPFIEPILLKISLTGEIIEEIPVLEILYQNQLQGLLAMPTTTDLNTNLTGDIMHLNDVEPFPSSLEEGFFTYGDIMISLRNINAILIYNLTNGVVKKVIIGDFVRQHDPDFIDGNTISLYDNYNVGSQDSNRQSRIVKITLPGEELDVYYLGNELDPFNSNIMGKHQWLENGNLLITDAMNGRAFEIDGNKEIVWEFINVLGNGTKGVVQEVSRIPWNSLSGLKK